jgi:transposase
MDLTDAQGAVLEPHFRSPRRADGRRRPWRDTRLVLNAVLLMLCTGAPQHALPPRYPPCPACHRLFQQWQRDGTLTKLVTRWEYHAVNFLAMIHLACILILLRQS